MNMPTAEKTVIAGLGNATHPRTFHSVGQLVLKHLAQRRHLQWNSNTKHGVSYTHINSHTDLIYSHQLMNVCGKSLARYCEHVNARRVLVLHDDLQREWGKVRSVVSIHIRTHSQTVNSSPSNTADRPTVITASNHSHSISNNPSTLIEYELVLVDQVISAMLLDMSFLISHRSNCMTSQMVFSIRILRGFWRDIWSNSNSN